MSEDEMSPAYARSVGARLRDVRRQQRLSLQAVEDASNREFKASVLGAYERGERIISVLRLQRLASLYAVPVDQLLPQDGPGRPTVGGAVDQAPISIDLAKLAASDAPEQELIQRYVGMIQIQRDDFNGKVITIRDEDVRAIARVFERDESSMRARFRELGITR